MDGKNYSLTAQSENYENIIGKELIIYTSTFYKDDEEGNVRSKLAINLFKSSKKLGINVVVSDCGTTNKYFLDELDKLDNINIVKSNKGMGEDRREALKIAMEKNPDKKYFFWIEPEKDNLITEANLKKMTDYANKGIFDIVVPKRDFKKSGLPKFQAWIEKRANKKIHDALKKEGLSIDTVLDLWFGPKLFTREGAKWFLDYKGDLDKWDAIIKPVYNAIKLGIKVGEVKIDYNYDSSQVKQEEGNRIFMKKRVDQYCSIIREILGQDTITLNTALKDNNKKYE